MAPRVATDLGVDVWHGPHYTRPLRGTVPSVVTVHDLTFFDHPEWHERTKVAYFRRIIPPAVQHADAIVAVSAFTAAGLRDRFGPTAPVYVAPHGVDHDRFRTDAAPDDDRRLSGIGVRPPYLAFVGLLEPRKDVPTLVARVRTRRRRATEPPARDRRRRRLGCRRGPGRGRRERGGEPDRPARLRPRRHRAGAAAQRRGRRVPVAHRGVRPARARGARVRRRTREHHGLRGRGGGRRRRAARAARRRRRAGRRARLAARRPARSHRSRPPRSRPGPPATPGTRRRPSTSRPTGTRRAGRWSAGS